MFSILCSSHIKLWRNPQRITKIKPFTNKYKWEGINYPSEKGDCKKIEKNSVTIPFNVLYAKKEKIYPAYVLKHKSYCEKQVILLMIDKQRWQATMALSCSQKTICIIRNNF